MGAAQASAAKGPASAGYAPPAALLAERASGDGYMPPLASLAAIPARPQRACGGGAREELPVQPRLEVGPVGDRYEQEADSIAGQVLAMDASELEAGLGDAAADAAPGVVQRSCSSCSASIDEPSARRTSLIGEEISQAEPMIQRKCGACSASDDRPHARRTTLIGEEIAKVDPMIQRKCGACAAAEDRPRPRALSALEPMAVDADEHRPRGLDAGGDETLAASDGSLTSGGAPLPERTRHYFERRMGRDLGNVRIHQGGAARALNASISARAFTYRDHIWLGAGESDGTSFTMAHELAHVMQQTAPGPVGPMPRRRGAATAGLASVRRVPCDGPSDKLFFAPKSSIAEKTAEHRYLTSLTKGTGILGEVPIPNATKSGGGGCSGIGSDGRADLVKSSNNRFVSTGMIDEIGSLNPRPWFTVDPAAVGCAGMTGKRLRPYAIPFYKQMIVDGSERFPKLREDSAPAWSRYGDSFLNDAKNAPTSIQIGEVKFGGTDNARGTARKQIDNYKAGIDLTHRSYENMRSNIDRGSNELSAGKKPSLTQWSLTTGDLTAISGTGGWQAIENVDELVIAKWEKKLIPVKGERNMEPRRCDGTGIYPGKFYGGHDAGMPHVWLYAWYPNSLPPQNVKGGAQYTGFKGTADTLMKQVTASPTQGELFPQRRPLASAAPAPARPIVQRRQPKPGKPLPKEDPFHKNYERWKEDRKALAKGFLPYEKTKEFGKDIEPLLFNSAAKNTKDITQSSPNPVVEPDSSQAMKTANKELRNLKIIAGPAGLVLGALRYHFGAFFLSVMEFFQKVKAKFQSLFAEPAKGSSSGLAGKAFHVFTKILGKVAAWVLPQITDALLDCAKDGIRKTIEGWIEGTPIAELEAKLQSYVAKAEALKAEVIGDVMSFVEGVFEPMRAAYESVKDEIKVIVDIVKIAKKAFNAARALACLAGGLETVGISCVLGAVDALLGLFDASPVETLLASLLGTCAAQQIFGKAILAVQKVRELPRRIAKWIVDVVRDKLPDSFKGFLCEPSFFDSLNHEMPRLDDVTCDEETVPQGRDWRIPSGISAAMLNRKPTPEEAAGERFDPRAAAGEIPLPEPPEAPPQPPPQSGAGGDKPAPVPVPGPGDQKQDTPTPPANAGQQSDDAATGPAGPADNLSIAKGKLAHPTGSLLITPYVHGVGRGFDIGVRPIPEPRNVQFSFTAGKKYYHGADLMSIKVLNVRKLGDDGKYVVTFTPDGDYILKIPGAELALHSGEVVEGYLGVRR